RLDRALVAGRVDRDGIPAAEARVAIARTVAFAGEQSLERQIAQRVDAEVIADLLDRFEAADQLATARRVDAVEAPMRHRRPAHPEVPSPGAGATNRAPQLAARRAAHDRIVDPHDPPPLEPLAHGIEFDAHARIALGLLRLDEGTPDVMVADQPQFET